MVKQHIYHFSLSLFYLKDWVIVYQDQIFTVFIIHNVVFILYYNYQWIHYMLCTFLVILFSQNKQYMIWQLSDILSLFISASAINDLSRICVELKIRSSVNFCCLLKSFFNNCGYIIWVFISINYFVSSSISQINQCMIKLIYYLVIKYFPQNYGFLYSKYSLNISLCVFFSLIISFTRFLHSFWRYLCLIFLFVYFLAYVYQILQIGCFFRYWFRYWFFS